MISLRAACTRVLTPSLSLPRTSIQARSLHLARTSFLTIPRLHTALYAPQPTLRRIAETRAFSLWPFTSSRPPPLSTPSPSSTSGAPSPATSPTATPDPVADTAAAVPPPPIAETLPPPPSIPEVLHDIADITSVASDAASWPVMHFGDLSALGLGMGFTPVAWTREAFEIVAASTGLPMWASILVLTVLIRAALLPLVIPSQINSTRLNNIQPQMKEIQEAVKAKLKSGDKVAAAFEQQKIRAIMKAHDVSLGKSFMYPVAQGITSISCFFAFRQMSLAPVPQLLEGGTLWFKDLTQAAHIFSDHSIWWAPWTWLGIDAMWGLPMAATAAMWVNAKYGGDMGAPATMQMQNMRSIASGMVILFCFITLTQPQAVCLYFLLNNLLLLLQGWILSIRPVRDYFGIPARDAAPEVAPVKPFRWRDFPSKVRRFVSGKWVEDMMKAVPEEPKQNRPRVQRPREPIKWIDQADAQRLMQEHRKSEVKHPSSPAEAHHQVHQLERDRLAKDQAAIKANRTAIKQEGRIQRPKGKHMR